ncbi:MAG: hypothetical protein OXM01_15165 [Gemmatimonadota bacterium]|nr:hypothetical protein [Gemmatimonadota bacterium]
MAQPIEITIKGTDTDGEDAPTVEDLLSQVQDFVFILHGVERAVAEDGREELVWRVTNATKNSPITFEVTPFPKTHGINVDRRAATVVEATAKGLVQISECRDRPPNFTDEVIVRAERINSRVFNGLSKTNINFSNYDDVNQIEITQSIAKRTIEYIAKFREPAPIKHREIGSIEGFIARVELDGYGRPVVWIRSRLDNQFVKCISNNGGLDRIGHFEVAEVLRGLRVRVFGTIIYKNIEQVDNIEVESVQVFAADHELPDSDSIVSPNFTSGVESSAYLKALREDG